MYGNPYYSKLGNSHLQRSVDNPAYLREFNPISKYPKNINNVRMSMGALKDNPKIGSGGDINRSYQLASSAIVGTTTQSSSMYGGISSVSGALLTDGGP